MTTDDRTTPGGERTRARILEVALPLFAEHGFAGTSVRMVSGAAGVNVATLAYHFGDKAGLYAATIDRLYEDLARFPLAPSPEAGADPLGAALRQGWAFVRERHTAVRLLHRHLLDAGRHHDAVLDTWTLPLLDRLRGVVLAVKPGWSESEFRLLVFSVMHLLVRFALEDRDQLARMAAIDGDVDEAVVDWVRGLVLARLAMP